MTSRIVRHQRFVYAVILGLVVLALAATLFAGTTSATGITLADLDFPSGLVPTTDIPVEEGSPIVQAVSSSANSAVSASMSSGAVRSLYQSVKDPNRRQVRSSIAENPGSTLVLTEEIAQALRRPGFDWVLDYTRISSPDFVDGYRIFRKATFTAKRIGDARSHDYETRWQLVTLDTGTASREWYLSDHSTGAHYSYLVFPLTGEEYAVYPDGSFVPARNFSFTSIPQADNLVAMDESGVGDDGAEYTQVRLTYIIPPNILDNLPEVPPESVADYPILILRKELSATNFDSIDITNDYRGYTDEATVRIDGQQLLQNSFYQYQVVAFAGEALGQPIPIWWSDISTVHVHSGDGFAPDDSIKPTGLETLRYTGEDSPFPGGYSLTQYDLEIFSNDENEYSITINEALTQTYAVVKRGQGDAPLRNLAGGEVIGITRSPTNFLDVNAPGRNYEVRVVPLSATWEYKGVGGPFILAEYETGNSE